MSGVSQAKPALQVERVEIKDVRLPVQLQRAMAAEAEAAREARAKVGEVTDKSLLSTPNLPGDSGGGREEGFACSQGCLRNYF